MSEAFSDPPSPRGALPHLTAGQRPPVRGAVNRTRTHESHRSPNTLTRMKHFSPSAACVFCSKCFTFISLFHFTDGKTKAQRGQVTCPNTQLVSPELGFSPGGGPGGHTVHTSVLREENGGGRLVSTLARAASGVSYGTLRGSSLEKPGPHPLSSRQFEGCSCFHLLLNFSDKSRCQCS